MKLSKAEWELLDGLLGKIGFGGYYDVVEVLKTTIVNLKPEMAGKIRSETDLYVLIMLVNALSLRRG